MMAVPRFFTRDRILLPVPIVLVSKRPEIKEFAMSKVKQAIVVGASRGIGRATAAALADRGVKVLAIARNEEKLASLKAEHPSVDTLAADARDRAVAERAYDTLTPDLVVIAAGAVPHTGPVHEHDWEQFSRVWETDVRITFEFATAALRRPLAPGATVLTLSSGAAFFGSPVSGGYAGAKRSQQFLSEYCQKESGRADLGIRFVALSPRAMLPATEVGKAATAGYGKYLGISAEEFAKRFDPPLTPDAAAAAVVAIATDPAYAEVPHFEVTGDGFKPVDLS